jgi:hypothetical protein
MHMTVIWNVDSTYVLPICGQSMVDSIVQCVWMTLMHSGFSTAGKSISLIDIKDYSPRVMSSWVTKSRFRKARALEKGHQSESSEQISWKYLVNLRSHRMVGSKVTAKSTTKLIKAIFGNSLMQKHWYYPTISIWCISSVILQKTS